MRLAKITHDRCNEYAATSYVWVSSDMTDDELHTLCLAAQDEYLKAEKTMAESAPVADPGWAPRFESFPESSVAVVLAEHKVKKAAWEAWSKKRDESRQPFVHHLIRLGKGRIIRLYERDPEVVLELSWGHRHGQTIAFNEYKRDKDTEED